MDYLDHCNFVYNKVCVCGWRDAGRGWVGYFMDIILMEFFFAEDDKWWCTDNDNEDYEDDYYDDYNDDDANIDFMNIDCWLDSLPVELLRKMMFTKHTAGKQKKLYLNICTVF